MSKFEDYVIPGTNILKNKLGITNEKELLKVENKMVIYKLSLLYLKEDYGNFDTLHLCNLHRYLFEDLYDFAGKLRDVDMYRESSSFCRFEDIPSKLDEVLNKYLTMNTNILRQFDLAKYLADFYRDLIEIHAFREGNGRTTREFLRELVVKKFPDYTLDFSKIDKRNFRIAAIDPETYPLLLAYEFNNALIKEKEKKL